MSSLDFDSDLLRSVVRALGIVVAGALGKWVFDLLTTEREPRDARGKALRAFIDATWAVQNGVRELYEIGQTRDNPEDAAKGVLCRQTKDRIEKAADSMFNDPELPEKLREHLAVHRPQFSGALIRALAVPIDNDSRAIREVEELCEGLRWEAELYLKPSLRRCGR